MYLEFHQITNQIIVLIQVDISIGVLLNPGIVIFYLLKV